MDILAALKQEEAKWEKQVSEAQQQLDNVRAAMKLLGGMNGSGKVTSSSTAETTGSSRAKTTGSSRAKTTHRKKRTMSAAARARISKATKERWAKFRAAKAKGRQ